MSYLLTAGELRAEGLPDDARAMNIAALAEQVIESITGFRFCSHTATFLIDGTGRPTITLPQPILSISAVTVNTVAVVEDTDFIARKSRPPGDDDRRWPRLETIRPNIWASWPSFWPASLPESKVASIWTRGQQNISVTGTFGYTDQVGSVEVPPAEIKRCALRLVALEIYRIGVDDDQMARRVRQYVQQFSAGEVSANLSAAAVSRKPIFGVPEIDRVLLSYSHPKNAASSAKAFSFGGA